MDLIGNIKFIENRLGGRKPKHDKGKSAQKDIHSGAADEKSAQADTGHSTTGHDTRLGRKVNTTA